MHRLAYSLLVGPLNADQHLHKACGGAGCVRPSGGHWGLSRRHVPGPRSDLPRGVRYEGTDKRGMDVWRISVYLGRDQRRKRVEQRVRVHGTLEQALRKRDQLLARLGEERRKLATGVRGKTMAELLDRYFAVWQKTPRKGYLPAKITIYHRHLLIEQLIKPALGHRLPCQVLPGHLADWYDELAENGYITPNAVEESVAKGRCAQCGSEVEAVAQRRRRTARANCPTAACGAEVVCRMTGERRQRTGFKQHPPLSASTLADVHAVLRGAFRFGVQRGWLAMGENPMVFVEWRTGQHIKQRPPTPEQVRAALSAAEQHRDPNLYPLLTLLADTGARLGEGLALRVSDLDVQECGVRIETSVSDPPEAFGGVHVKDTKTHTKRAIAVHRQTMLILLRHVDRCRRLAEQAGVQVAADPFVFPSFQGHRWRIAPDQPTRPTKMSRSVSMFFSSLGLEFTAKSLRAFMVTNWRQARVPDDVLRGRVGHDEATPVTDRHYHYREGIADRQETDRLVSRLLYARDDGDDDSSAPDRSVISLDAVRARRRLG